jgi:FeS assembly SUF system regulator
MVRLNKLTDYAVVILAEMAQAGGVTTASALAARTGVPGPTVAKLLKILAQRGLTLALRGRAGGYGLSRAPTAINVAEIIEAIEGPVAVAACVEGALENCEFEPVCAMNGHWNRVNEVIRRALTGVTLADMVDAETPAFGFPRPPAKGRERGLGETPAI